MDARSAPNVTPVAARKRQAGGAMVEFAFVFPILFLLVYGVIVYAYVYVIQQSITYAAQEAAEAAVAVDPEQDDPFTQQQDVARQMAISALSWLPESQKARVLGEAGDKVEVELCEMGGDGCPADSDGLIVRLRFTVRPEGSGCATNALFPMLNLYMVGCVPPLPATLSATAVVRV